ncbi:CAD17 protein, partial [Polypterus senegalus]|nr:CAD17 protein [Polypterus senegalus]
MQYTVSGETENKIHIDSDGSLFLNDSLDWETRNVHNIQISVQDENSVTVEGPVNIKIIVLDINDNKPIFNQSIYNGVVRQHSRPGRPFMRVFATDKDDPNTPNAKLNYSILTQIPELHQVNLFQIDSETGEISSTPDGARQLDPSKHKHYVLFITVKDLEGLSVNSLSDNAKVQIEVKENLWQPPGPVTIKENSTEPHPVFITQVRWNEPGAIYELGKKERNSKFPFMIDRDGKIYVTDPLDSEESERYVLVVFAKGKNNENLEQPLEILILVEDINDNPPVCVQDVTTFEVQENEKIGNQIGILQATDMDRKKENSFLKYELLDQEPDQPNARMFMIDPYSANIQISSDNFQKKIVSEYKLNVRVSDMDGEPTGFSTNCSVTIKVIDINNKIPVFDKLQYPPLNISEDAAIGTLVYKICATDADDPGTGSWKIIYKVAEGDPAGMFIVDTDEETNEGYVKINKHLNFEKVSLYHLRIDARNPEPLVFGINYNSSSSTYLAIGVNNVNEAPEFDSSFYHKAVLENITVGSVILRVHAIDPEGSLVRYRLEDDKFDWLTIDPNTGEITTQAYLDREVTSLYTIHVLATDTTDLVSSVYVSISLEDVNDNPPSLDVRNNPHIFCYPLQQKHHVRIKATDKDLSQNGPPFQFSIQQQHLNDWEISVVDGRPILDFSGSGVYMRIRIGKQANDKEEKILPKQAKRRKEYSKQKY